MLQSGYLQGTCKVPDGIEIGDTCAFWYDNKDTMGSANWGFMNLDQWNVPPGENCTNAGSSSRSDWIANGYPDLRTLNGAPPGSAPTYVCNDTGHSTRDWSDLFDQKGQIKMFPVNDCTGQLGKTGAVAPCPETPDKYDIIGFTSLLIKNVYKGNDALAIGTVGASGGCSKDLQSGSPAFDADGDVTRLQTINLTTFGTYGPACGGFNSASAISSLVVSPKKGSNYVQCPPGVTTGCHYTYDAAHEDDPVDRRGHQADRHQGERRRSAHLVQLAERGHARRLRGAPVGSERDLPGDRVAGIHHGPGPGGRRRGLRPVRDRAVRSELLRRLSRSGLNLR